MLRSKVVTPNTALLVSLVDFKQEIKWDPSDNSEDTTMETDIRAATLQAEAFTRRVLASAPWKSTLSGFCYRVKLDVLPVTSIVVKYYDEANAIQTLNASEYIVEDNGPDDFVEIVFDGTMPNVYDRYDAVQIEYTAGYTALPANIKLGILKLAVTYYEIRQNEAAGVSFNTATFGAHQILYPSKIMG